MQNLTTTHLNEIKQGETYVPAGKGKTNFIDTRDIGAVIAKVLVEGKMHLNKAYELTGRESFDYYQIAEILTKKLGRKITYKNANPIMFLIRKIKMKVNPSFAIVMLALYSVARLGKADNLTDEFQKLMKRKTISFEQFVDDNKKLFVY